MKLLHALFNRTEVKSYCAEVVDEVLIHSLLAAANQAPIGTNPQPCTFAIVQDRKALARYSCLAAQRMRDSADAPSVRRSYPPLANHDYSIFYDASTLIVLCAYANDPLSEGECWLAAQNLWLAASEHGLGACCVEFALGVLNEPAIKAELHIPDDMRAVVPLILGWPASVPTPIARIVPRILSWRTASHTAAEHANANAGLPPRTADGPAIHE